MVYYVKQGNIPASRHTFDSRENLLREELFGEESFDGPYSLIYHRNEPTRVTGMEDARKDNFIQQHGNVHRHIHLLTGRLQRHGDIITGRDYLLYNDKIRIGVSRPVEQPKTYFRHAICEILLFIHEGDGVLYSPFGYLRFRKNDYVYIPKGTTWFMEYSGDLEVFFLESMDRISIPRRYLNIYGQLIEGTPYYSRDFVVPDLSVEMKEPEEPVVIIDYDDSYVMEHRDRKFFDTVGWDGYLYPFAINVEKMAPIVGKLHQPPPVHETFSGKSFMVGTFLPRLFDFHPRSIPISYYHNNIDTDEVLFYSSGNFMSRRGISRGSITMHTRGIIHGPQPGAVESAIGKKETDEIAVMVEAYDPLKPTSTANGISDPNYMKSWIS